MIKTDISGKYKLRMLTSASVMSCMTGSSPSTQFWVAVHGMDLMRHRFGSHSSVLWRWRAPSFLMQGVPMGVVLSRKVFTTDASQTGWGGVQSRSARGSWDTSLQYLHIYFLELSVVFLSLKQARKARVLYVTE